MRSFFFKRISVWPFLPRLECRNWYRHSRLRFQDVAVLGTGICLFIRHSKTDQLGRGCRVQLYPCRDPIICPSVVITKYLAIRPGMSGNFLIHPEGLPLTKYQFSSMFKKCLWVIGLSDVLFSTHSFRIGAAIEA